MAPCNHDIERVRVRSGEMVLCRLCWRVLAGQGGIDGPDPMEATTGTTEAPDEPLDTAPRAEVTDLFRRLDRQAATAHKKPCESVPENLFLDMRRECKQCGSNWHVQQRIGKAVIPQAIICHNCGTEVQRIYDSPLLDSELERIS